MILSRANLLIVGLTKKEGDGRLNNLHIAMDGSTVTTNSRSIVAVSPVRDEVKKNLSFYEDGKETGRDTGTITSETIKNVLKYMPKDTIFNGLLEHCDFNAGEFKINDGKRWHQIVGKIFNRNYINYKEVFRKVGASKETKRIAINFKTLLEVLQVMEKAGQNSNTENPLYIEITKEGQLLLRTHNHRTGQRIIGVTSAYKEDQVKWMDLTSWEMKLLGLIPTGFAKTLKSVLTKSLTKHGKTILKSTTK